MNFDAIIVAGGRGSRLGGMEKPLLVRGGATLLEHTLQAVSAAHRIVVVGSSALEPVISGSAGQVDAAHIIMLTREYPAFGGPAAAVAEGIRALQAGEGAGLPAGPPRSPLTLVLAADLINPGAVVDRVLGHVGSAAGTTAEARAWVPVDAAGHLQPLSSVFETPALDAAVADAEAAGHGLANSSMMQLLAKVHLVRLPLDDVDFADVDTWADAERAGISRPITE